MTSNLYGYNDYSGPQIIGDAALDPEGLSAGSEVLASSETVKGEQQKHDDDDDDDDYDHDPLRSGLWMEGDSLAPPCGTSVSTIHKILRLASVSSDDVVYDLGCGDGRVCLEALVQHQCRHCVGVEIELDLVHRFEELIATLPPSMVAVTATDKQEKHHTAAPRIFAVHSDLRDILSALLAQLVTDNDTTTDDNTTQTTVSSSTTTTTTTLSLKHQLPTPTVIFLYLLPESIAQLEPSLISLLQRIPRLRLVMNTWGLTSVPASQTVQVWEDDAVCVSSQILIYDGQSLEKHDEEDKE